MVFDKQFLVGAVITRGGACWYRVDATRCTAGYLRVCMRDATSGKLFGVAYVLSKLKRGEWEFHDSSPIQMQDLVNKSQRIVEANKDRNTNKAHTFAVAYGDNTPIVEETKMSNTINSLKDTAVTSVHVVFGTVITSDTPDSFFVDLMRKLKEDIDALNDVLDSAKMTAKRDELVKQRTAIVKLFDSRT